MSIPDYLYPDVAAGNTSNDATTDAINYQFSGYHIPRVQWDATGPAMAVPGVHPYYFNQPTFWLKGYTTFSPRVCFGQPSTGFIENMPPEVLPPTPTTVSTSMMMSAKVSITKGSSSKSKLFKMKPL